jgi:hypothetical protein
VRIADSRLTMVLGDDTVKIRDPYRGLLAFEPDDAELFSGREAATERSLDLLDRHPIVGVVGASGSGKSSLVKAGIIAQLRKRRDPSWCTLSLRPGGDPIFALTRAVIKCLDRDFDEWESFDRARDLAAALHGHRAECSSLLDRIVQSHTESGAPRRILVFVDQWEELYTQVERSDLQRAFLDSLLMVLNQGPHRLIFTMRADFTGHLLENHREFFAVAEPGILMLPRMTRDELEQAIRRPAKVVGLNLENNLVETILDHADEKPYALPLVEFALTQLWEKRDGDQITLRAYDAMGGLVGAIDHHADAALALLSPEQRRTALSALRNLVRVSSVEFPVRTRRRLAEFGKQGQTVIRALAEKDTRLVVISYDEEVRENVVELSHEVLIREWKILHDLVPEEHKFRQWKAEVEERFQRYRENGNRKKDLLVDFELREAQSWIRTSDAPVTPVDDISPSVLNFVNASEVRRRRKDNLFRAGSIAALIVAFLSIGLWFYAQREEDCCRQGVPG